MKKIFIILLFLIVHCTLKIEDCTCQWVQTNGPNGGWCYSMYSFNGYLFAGTGGGGLFRSSDNGNTWSFIFNPTSINFCDIEGITSLGSYLFITTGTNVIYRSSDNGNTFQVVNNGLPLNSIYSIISSGQYIICGTYRLFRSSNYGLSWDSCKNEIPYAAYIHHLISIGPNVYAATGSGLYKSTNNGANWISINNGFNTNTIETIGSDGINFYAGGSNGMYKSTNSGNNWVQINNGMPPSWVYGIGFAGNNVFAATYEGLYRSSNAGANWETCNNGMVSEADNGFLYSGNRLFCYTSGGAGIQYTTDNGTSWRISNEGLHNFAASSIAIKNNLIFACGYMQGLAVSSNDGASWYPISNNLIDRFTNDIASNSSCIFLSSGTNGMLKSTNNGANWIQCNNGISDSSTKLIYAYDDLIIVSSSYGTYRSTNNGNSWISIGTSFSFKTLAKLGNIILAGNDFMEGGGMIRSTNNGINWSTVQGFLPRSIIAKDSVFYLINPPLSFNKSTNLGLNWTTFSSDYTGYPNKMYVVDNKLVIISDFGVYTSSNNGVNWISRNQGLPNVINSYSLIIKDNNIFLGTDVMGVWKRLKSDLIPVENISSEIPKEFVLYQNYPNPFNPTTKIKFQIPSDVKREMSNVRLIIFDITGREIITLVNEQLNPGTYEATFDGSNLPSGIYFYRLTAGDFTSTKKLILLK